jgi:hypothetical protein
MTLAKSLQSTSNNPRSRTAWVQRYQLQVDENRNIAGPPPLPVGSWYVDDFTTGIISDWTLTTVEGAGSATEVTSGPAGILTLTNGTALNDSDQIQLTTAIHNLTAAKDLYYETRVKISDADKTASLYGLTVVDTSVIASAPTDGVYFQTGNASANLLATTRASSTGTGVDTGVDVVDATFITLGFLFSGTTVYFYVNGTQTTTSTANIPAAGAALVPTFAVRNGEAAAKSLAIDYYKIFQER